VFLLVAAELPKMARVEQVPHRCRPERAIPHCWPAVADANSASRQAPVARADAAKGMEMWRGSAPPYRELG